MKEQEIISQIKEICLEIANLPLAKKIDLINKIRYEIHQISPFKNNPVDYVQWVISDVVEANDYNPNIVASPEFKSLQNSIAEDGYTQPIVAWEHEEGITVVDGFHRNLVGRIKKFADKLYGYLPIVNIRGDRTSLEDRIKSTVRHNRARGKHQISGMAEVVIKMRNEGVSDLDIAKGLGLEGEELLRLKQQTGIIEMFKDQTHSKAWKAVEDLSPDQL